MSDATHEPPRTTPRWVKVFVIVTIVLVVLGVVIFLISGGQHGPARHVPGGGGGDTPSPAVSE
jgi:hypothetical protein